MLKPYRLCSINSENITLLLGKVTFSVFITLTEYTR